MSFNLPHIVGFEIFVNFFVSSAPLNTSSALRESALHHSDSQVINFPVNQQRVKVKNMNHSHF